MRSSSESETSPSSSATPRHRSSPLRRTLDRWGDTRWGGVGMALLAILGGAAVLRFVGIQYGLPFGNLLNPDERSIVPRAWKLVHGGGGDPHWFDYPTLLMYVNAPFQIWHDEPSYLTARIVAVGLALGAIAAAWWLGRRAFGTTSAGAVAAAAVAVCTIHVAYSRTAVTDVPLTLGVAVALALMVAGRLELAGVAAGLAMGFKYPGLLLLVPLVIAGWRQWSRLAVSVALAIAAFLASSPFLLVHREQAWDDVRRVQRLARDGWLGFEHDHPAPVAFVDRLWEGLGPALIVGTLGLVVALVQRSRTDLILAGFVLVYFVDLLTLDAHFDRYVLPLVPPLGARIAADPSTPNFANLRVLNLRLPGPKREFDANRSLARLRQLGIQAVVVTGAVTDRVLAARSRYPREARFYDDLRRRAKRIFYLQPGGDRSGPW